MGLNLYFFSTETKYTNTMEDYMNYYSNKVVTNDRIHHANNGALSASL